MSGKSEAQIPDVGSKLNFAAATVHARKIHVQPKPIGFTSCHRGQCAKCDYGYIIIEKKWNVWR